MKDRRDIIVPNVAGRVTPDGRIACPRRAGGVDPELCYACGTPCSTAQWFTGRSPDRDCELLDRFGVEAFRWF